MILSLFYSSYDFLVVFISDSLKDAVQTWQNHDDALNMFCEMDGEHTWVVDRRVERKWWD